uniref:Uncharacterized protein n=1 Tax=Trichobilharzia regenti TaxID=157069 RepID=A0AA85JK78_TRIRE|nr:unnamed protein product [Trichobilharzia regenti]
MVEKHGSQILVNKSTSNQRRHVNHRLVTLSKKRRISYRRIIFILNVFAGVVLQLAIAFGITCLFTQVIKLSYWNIKHPAFLWTGSAIYFVLEILWVFIRNVSRTLPWNIIYLLIMALMSSIIIGTECIEYNDDVPLFVQDNECYIYYGNGTGSNRLLREKPKYDFSTDRGGYWIHVYMLSTSKRNEMVVWRRRIFLSVG